MSGPRELLNDEMEYENMTEGYRICKRGILVCDEDTEDTGITSFFADSLKIVLTNNCLRDELRKNESIYMTKYTNEKVLDGWRNLIEEPYESMQLYADREMSKKVYIYGAGFWGEKTLEALTDKGIKVAGFVVSDRSKVSDQIQGYPVVEISEIKEKRNEVTIMLGTRYGLYSEIVASCEKNGFNDIRYVIKKPEV